MAVRYSYLPQQFGDCPELWEELKSFVLTGDFTLGAPLKEFEEGFAKLIGTKHAVGVNSGTDAIKLSLKALDVGQGDEIITAANTFVATVGAICEIGATPVFVDCNENFCMDVGIVESVINERTKAIVPVHLTGYMTRMDKLLSIAEKYSLPIIEDACQSILAELHGRQAGTWGISGAFSLHPLKNINVWSDGGVIVTDSDKLDSKLRLLRNHGLVDRDHVKILGYNSRLDTFQAVVGNWILPQARQISNQRIKNATYLDERLGKISQISIPHRPSDMRIVFHLYSVLAHERDALLEFCIKRGVEAKIHYPIPIYKQEALVPFVGNRRFEKTDFLARNSISFPCDQHLTMRELDEIVETVQDFYAT